MTRRKLVALVSAGVLFLFGLVIFVTGLVLLRTSVGRERLLTAAKPLIARIAPGGSVYVGHWSGSLISGITIDSIAIRDKRGELFLSTGPVTVEYNWRDLIDNRVLIHRARVEHPFVHIVQHENGVWNFKEIFPSSNQPSPPRNPEARNFGDYIVIDSATAHNGTFLLTLSWHPDTALHGASRDSAIRAELKNPAKAVSKTFDGYGRLYAWRDANGLISHVRLADPDSDRYGRQFNIATLSVNEYEPTFQFRNVRGEARLLGDSVWFQAPHFDMPASTGNGHGKVWWGSDLPVRYDIAIRGDSVSLNDVNWVYPTLPRTGGGSVDLSIKNDPKNLQVVYFGLQKMNMNSTKSHLTGDMSFGIGEPVLLVRGVDLRADPVDFDLIRTLNGKPFPIDWQGQLVGTVKARGGPLTHFYVDDGQATFMDAHVKGAESRVSGRGELDILEPAFTAFHAFDVDAQSVDLRSIEYLFPSFPKLGGFLSGTATLDSSWLDVRFSNASIEHQDGPGEPSHVTGSGRVTDGEKFMTYDVALDADPLSLPTLSRSYPFLPKHGLLSGPIRATGSSPDLALSMSLQGNRLSLSYDGRVNLDSTSGYGARGGGQFSNVDLAGLFDVPRPVGTLSGHYDLDVRGNTAAALQGSANVDLERTLLDSVRVYPSTARLRFADGRMLVDSLFLRTAAATVTAKGGIGLPKGVPDSLKLSMAVDSLGGLRPLIPRPDTTLLGAATPLDSLSGSIRTRDVVVSGTLDALNLSGQLVGDSIYINKDRGERLAADFRVNNVVNAPSGAVSLKIDTVTLGGIALDTLGVIVHFDDLEHGSFLASALSHNGPTAAAGGSLTRRNGAQNVLLDSLGLAIGDDRWRLARPASLVFDSTGRRLDSLLLLNRDTATIVASANVPDSGQAFVRLVASKIPLREAGTFEQLGDTLTGLGDLSVTATGTRANPKVDAALTLSSIDLSGLDIDHITTTAAYRDHRVNADLAIVRRRRTSVTATASLPVDLTLFSMHPINDTISGTLRADSTRLEILRPLFGAMHPDLSGVINVRLAASGTMRKPVFNDTVVIANGNAGIPPLGITLKSINGRVTGGLNARRQDSTNVALSARTSDRDSVSLTGWVRNFLQSKGGDSTAFALTLAADSLHAFNKRTVADIYLSTGDPLQLTGTIGGATLRGSINVDRGSIFLADPDLARKQAVDFIIPTDTTHRKSLSLNGSALAQKLMTNLTIANVPVKIGQDVRLRSAEANVRLGGQLTLMTSTDQSTRRLASTGELVPGLALNGQLTTLGGTYNLNLGLVQREFQVLADGRVTFDGPPTTPFVDIRAQYNVKQPPNPDLGVIVNLKGQMPTPTIEFSSNAGYEISQSDLLSYLIVGRPGFFATGTGSNTTQVVASFLSPTLSAVAADQLRRTFGSTLDVFQFELGGANYTSETQQSNSLFSGRTLTQYLSGATIGAEKQITNNLYAGLTTGLCQLQNSRLSLGAKVDYQFSPKLSARFGYDPATSARYCNEGQGFFVGTVPTPQNFSLSLVHQWRF